MNAQVIAVKTVQTAIPELGREEKSLYFLKITTPKGETTMNVGEKTYKTIIEITKPDQHEKQTVTPIGKIK